MKDEHNSSAALPLLVVCLFMLAVMGGGFFLVKKFHIDAAPTATSPTISPTTTPIPPLTPTIVPTAPSTLTAPLSDTSDPLGDPSTSSDVQAVIARIRPGFRRCYNRGLQDDPTISGNMVIEIEIGGTGEVTNVKKVSGLGLPDSVERCIMTRARGAQFAAPGVASAKVRVPITFVKS